MLSALRIQNFKVWKDSDHIRLAPITVLFGNNSAGKSSFTQFLLLLKQTADSSDQKRALHFGDEKSFVDLGTAHDVAHAHQTGQPISFQLRIKLSQELVVEDPLSGSKLSGESLELDATVRIDSPQPTVTSLTYTLLNGDIASLSASLSSTEKKGYQLTADHYSLVRHKGRPWGLPPPYKFYRPPTEVLAYYQNAQFLYDFAFEIEKAFSRLYYLGPLREYPKRNYTVSGSTPETVGIRGDKAVEAIIAASDRRLNLGYRRPTKSFQELVSSWLQELGLIESFEVKPIGKNRKEYEVLLKTRGSTNQVPLTDVGFGLSQVLPVIVQCFYSEPNSILLFEQPEIHLHPRVQAGLADLFIAATQARENGKPRNCQVIVETHSEHFLHRLMRRVAEEAIDVRDLAVYFIETSGDVASARPLEIDLFGNILNWPKDFFGDEMSDITARIQAAAARTKATAS